jgi:P pilus assembly chaperone PapD
VLLKYLSSAEGRQGTNEHNLLTMRNIMNFRLTLDSITIKKASINNNSFEKMVGPRSSVVVEALCYKP